MHILQRRCLLFQLWLKNAVIHQIYASHASHNHVGWLVRSMVAVMTHASRHVHHWGANDSVYVLKSWVSTTVLVKCVRLVDCCRIACDVIWASVDAVSVDHLWLPTNTTNVRIYVIWIVLLSRQVVLVASILQNWIISVLSSYVHLIDRALGDDWGASVLLICYLLSIYWFSCAWDHRRPLVYKISLYIRYLLVVQTGLN